MSEHDSIYVLMSRVMADIGAIAKDQRNPQQNFNFRGIDQVMNALTGPLTKHGVFYAPEVLDAEYVNYQTSKGTAMRNATLTVAYNFYGPQGDSVRVVTKGEASDSGDKATNKALAASLKYALLHTFCIPTEEQRQDDADAHSPAVHSSEREADASARGEAASAPTTVERGRTGEGPTGAGFDSQAPVEATAPSQPSLGGGAAGHSPPTSSAPSGAVGPTTEAPYSEQRDAAVIWARIDNAVSTSLHYHDKPLNTGRLLVLARRLAGNLDVKVPQNYTDLGSADSKLLAAIADEIGANGEEFS